MPSTLPTGPISQSGEWRRAESGFRGWIVPPTVPDEPGNGRFRAEPGRFHLYAAWNCPWAHRALLVRNQKRLDNLIDVSFVAPKRTVDGWVFDPQNGYADALFSEPALKQIYLRSMDDYDGRVTVPVLWDRKSSQIISNESADIAIMFNDAFVGLADDSSDLYPPKLRAEIDAVNERVYKNLNNGVYRAGFASSQKAYETAVGDVFETLDELEQRLSRTRFLCGSQLTLADWRLLPTLVRFDVAYYGAFKCNIRRLTDYTSLWEYARELYQMDGVAETVKFDIYKRGYFSQSEARNPFGIVPAGPYVDWTAPHSRGI
jgi:putative glutathione S-transferase